MKSSEASWQQIGAELGISGPECRRIYQHAIPVFIAKIKALGLTEAMEATRPE